MAANFTHLEQIKVVAQAPTDPPAQGLESGERLKHPRGRVNVSSDAEASSEDIKPGDCGPWGG
jgi:hypothetical protein